jgi:hypothetical protein
MKNGEIRKVTVLAPAAQHAEIWQLRVASGPGQVQTISAFYVQAAAERLDRIRKRVRKASR